MLPGLLVQLILTPNRGKTPANNHFLLGKLESFITYIHLMGINWQRNKEIRFSRKACTWWYDKWNNDIHFIFPFEMQSCCTHIRLSTLVLQIPHNPWALKMQTVADLGKRSMVPPSGSVSNTIWVHTTPKYMPQKAKAKQLQGYT